MNTRRVLFALATSETFEWAISHMPGARARAWRSARRYVAGERAEDALAVAASVGRVSIDLFGERVSDPAVVRAVVEEYERLAARLGEDAWLSLDLSHVGFDVEALRRVAASARVQVGAEEAAVTDRVLDAVVAVGGERVDATLQANLPRSFADAERLASAGVPVRVVKGAYVEHEALPWGAPTDDAYVRLALALRDAGATVRLATHDERLLERLLPELPDADVELLLGVRPELIASLGRRVRIYVPYGPDWFRYFMRRRAEAQGA